MPRPTVPAAAAAVAAVATVATLLAPWSSFAGVHTSGFRAHGVFDVAVCALAAAIVATTPRRVAAAVRVGLAAGLVALVVGHAGTMAPLPAQATFTTNDGNHIPPLTHGWGTWAGLVVAAIALLAAAADLRDEPGRVGLAAGAGGLVASLWLIWGRATIVATLATSDGLRSEFAPHMDGWGVLAGADVTLAACAAGCAIAAAGPKLVRLAGVLALPAVAVVVWHVTHAREFVHVVPGPHDSFSGVGAVSTHPLVGQWVALASTVCALAGAIALVARPRRPTA